MATLRERTGTLDLESRPRVNEKLNFLQRWATTTTRKMTTLNHQRRQQQQQQHNAVTIVMAPSNEVVPAVASMRTGMIMAASRQVYTNNNIINTTTAMSIVNHHHKQHQRHAMMMPYSYPSSPTTTTTSNNLFEWMQTECPGEILPRILAFTGPQMAQTLSRTNRFWKKVLDDDATWRVLCEELYKWKQGDEAPESWREFYKYNPCVPVDYSTVHAALGLVDVARNDTVAQPSTVRLLLRPGQYILQEAITIQENNNNTNDNGAMTTMRRNHRSIAVELATMEHFPEAFFPSVLDVARNASSSPAEQAPSKKRKSSIRRIFQCRTVEVEEEEDNRNNHPDNDLMDVMDPVGRDGGIPAELLLENHPLVAPTIPSSPSFSSSSSAPIPTVKRASLILRTRRSNEPLFRVRQGTCTIRNIELKHNCSGTDIWNGNAAVQLQPPIGPDEQPLLMLPPPTVNLDRVEISSASGRGIVNIDGGLVNITSCYVHDCAATGIYVGGPGSRANIERSDVVRNGNGNTQHRRGIARGHSGIYLEQGHASIIDCNVSRNSLTGISAVSPDNAVLILQESDLMSNGTYQLEMPAVGTVAHRKSNTSNNTLSNTGLARARSGLVMED